MKPWKNLLSRAVSPGHSRMDVELPVLSLAACLCDTSELDRNNRSEPSGASVYRNPGQSIPPRMTPCKWLSMCRATTLLSLESKGEDQPWNQPVLEPRSPSVVTPASRKGSRMNLVDPASSHMLRSRAKPCTSQRKRCNSGSVNGSLHQQSST